MRRLLYPIVLLLLLGCEHATDSDPVNALTGVPVFDAWIPQERYVSMLSNRWSNEEVPVDIYVDGKKYSGTVEPQGAGSRYHVRWSFKLELREGQAINGLQTSNLSVQTFDNSRLRTPLAAQAFAALNFPSVRSHPFFLRINGVDRGLYLQVERIDEAFFRKRSLPVDELIKCGFGSRFTYRDNAHPENYLDRQIPASGSLNDFTDFLHALDDADPDRLYEQISRYLNINQYLRYHALSSVLNHVDGFTNNLYFYRAKAQDPYSVIPWDFDKLLYEASDVGLVGENDIISKLLQNDSCVAVYKREVLSALDVALDENAVRTLLDSSAERIADAHRLDPWLGGAGISLSNESYRLKVYLTERKDFFREHLQQVKRYPR